MVIPYICFSGNCTEALEFYETALSGKNKSIMTYDTYITQSGAMLTEEQKNYIVHAEMEICGQKFWFADELEPVKTGDQIKLALCYPTKDRAMDAYENLRRNGQVIMEPQPQAYGAMHAVVIDLYGICWNILCEKE